MLKESQRLEIFMTRIKQAGPPVVVIAVIAGIIGYILGCTNAAREEQAQAEAALNTEAQDNNAALENNEGEVDDEAPTDAAKVIDRDNPYKQPDWVKEGWPEEVTPVVERLYEDFNDTHGTELEFK